MPRAHTHAAHVCPTITHPERSRTVHPHSALFTHPVCAHMFKGTYTHPYTCTQCMLIHVHSLKHTQHTCSHREPRLQTWVYPRPHRVQSVNLHVSTPMATS